MYNIVRVNKLFVNYIHLSDVSHKSIHILTYVLLLQYIYIFRVYKIPSCLKFHFNSFGDWNALKSISRIKLYRIFMIFWSSLFEKHPWSIIIDYFLKMLLHLLLINLMLFLCWLNRYILNIVTFILYPNYNDQTMDINVNLKWHDIIQNHMKH